MPSGVYIHKKGYKRPSYSEEWKRKISIAKKAKPTNYWLGKKRPELKKFFTMKGKHHSEETKIKMLGRKGWNKGLKGLLAGENSPHWKGGKPKCHCGKIISYGKKLCIECYKKTNPHKGSKNYNWKNGISKINKTERQWLMEQKEYKLWRKSVFERDNYTCVWCGIKRYLEADHIKPWALYPELRFAIDNGRTLCKDCHKTTDTYGFKLKLT